jgi:hypothetical protein
MYKEETSELFFLTSDEVFIDLSSLRKKPTPEFASFLQTHNCPKQILDEVTRTVGIPVIFSNNDSDLANRITTQHPSTAVKPVAPATNNANTTSTPFPADQTEHPFAVPTVPTTADPTTLISSHVNNTDSQSEVVQHPDLLPSDPETCLQKSSIDSWTYPAKAAVSSTFREGLMDKVKQEAWVLRRVQELSKEGLWSMKRFPKVCEKPRVRTQWDFLLQEMQWLSVDFYQERQWKKSAAKLLAYSAKEFVEKWHELKSKKAAEEEYRRRKIASFSAREVRNFWAESARLVEVKQNFSPVSKTLSDVPVMAEGICENGILDSAEEDSEAESTISEQEHYESKHESAESGVEELKNLAFDLSQPIESLIPEGYCDTSISEHCLVKNEIETDEFVSDEEENESHFADENEKLPTKLIRTSLSNKQKKLYDDVLADANHQSALETEEISEAAKIIARLRQVCNQPDDDDGHSSPAYSLLNFPRIADMDFHRLVTGVLKYDPFKHFDLASLNLVFLAHESELTAITSNRIAKCCAPKKLIEELPLKDSNSNAPPPIPQGRIVLEIQSNPSRSVSSRILPHPIKSEEKTRKTEATNEDNSRAFHKDSLSVIASFNERRCKGLPLYGQDLISALTVVDSVRPSKTRFRGMGYVNCLNALTSCSALSKKKPWRDRRSDFFQKTAILTNMVSLSRHASFRKMLLLKPCPPLALVQNLNSSIHTESAQIVADLAKLASKYFLPVKAVKEDNPFSGREGLCSSMPKTDKLFELFKDIRSSAERVVVFCELEDSLWHLRRAFHQSNLPFIFFDGDAPKIQKLRQLARFLRNPTNFCLLTKTSSQPSDQV